MKITKIISVLITISVLAVSFVLLQFGLMQLNRSFQLPQTGIDVVTLLIILLVFPYVQRLITKGIENSLNRRSRWVKSQLLYLAKEVQYITHLLRLQRVIVRRISEIFNLQAVSLFCADSSGEAYELSDCYGFNIRDKKRLTFKASGGFLVWMKMTKRPLEISKLKQSERYKYLGNEEKEKLRKLQAALCIPIIYAEKIIGMLFLSQKNKKKSYTKDEIEKLCEVAAEAAQAIDNATTHRNLNSLQRTLTSCQNHNKQLENRCSDLKKSNQKLLDFIKMGILVLKSREKVININEEFAEKIAVDVEQRYQDFVMAKAEKKKAKKT